MSKSMDAIVKCRNCGEDNPGDVWIYADGSSFAACDCECGSLTQRHFDVIGCEIEYEKSGSDIKELMKDDAYEYLIDMEEI